MRNIINDENSSGGIEVKSRYIKIAALAAICCALLLCGCGAITPEEKALAEPPSGGQDPFAALTLGEAAKEPREFSRAVWISYLDLAKILSANEETFEQNLSQVMTNLVSIKTTDIYLQVRAFGEALYNSEVFPGATALYSDYSADIDYLARFIERSHESGIKVHAWINPYRLGDIGSEPYASLAEALKSADGRAVITLESGSFINPASDAARELVLADIAALFADYELDGAQFDDYFYPSTDAALDEAEYAAYTEGGGALALNEWRRDNVSGLVRGACAAVRSSGEGRVFGVSPDASIERNMHAHFADVERWCSESGYIDYICPQVYYGYQNETRPFTAVVDEWKALSPSCSLIIGISAYKTGAEDSYAGSGALEWRENFDIISRQYADSREDGRISGAAFFRYGSLFAPDESVEAFANLELYALRSEIASEE